MDTPTLPMARDISSAQPMSQRAWIVGSITLGLGLSLAMVATGGLAWGDFAVLGALAFTTAFGANEARRLVQNQRAQAEVTDVVSEGQWMSVICKPAGPADTTGITAIPKAPPRSDPERRSLVRRARESRKPELSRR